MGPELLIFGGIAVVLLLRAMANANANAGGTTNVTKAAATYVPFPHAGNISSTGTPYAGNNPRNLNGNGQQIPVANPDANVINNGAQDAVLEVNFSNSTNSSLNGNPTFAWKDLGTGVVTQEPTYWRANVGTSPDGTANTVTWVAPVNYSGPPQMINCQAPGDTSGNEDQPWSSRYMQVGNGQISW
jgi:hypothetical protein